MSKQDPILRSLKVQGKVTRHIVYRNVPGKFTSCPCICMYSDEVRTQFRIVKSGCADEYI